MSLPTHQNGLNVKKTDKTNYWQETEQIKLLYTAVRV